MSLPLIQPDQDFALWAVLIGLAAFGFWCERFAWGRKYSGVMLLITAAIVLANLRVIPTSAPVYDTVWDYLVPIAVPLLLFQADLMRVFREAGPTLIAFAIGGAAVVAGAIVGVSVLDLGPNEAELAGIFTGTYIGGGLNFAAVAEATGMRESSQLAAAYAADNVITNLHFLLIIFIPGIAWLRHRFPSAHMSSAEAFNPESDAPLHHIENLSIAGLLSALTLAFIVAALGDRIAVALGHPEFGILVTTAIALAIASLFPKQVAKLSGYHEAGVVLMFVFLASVGASCDIWELIAIAPVLFVFATIIIVVHLAILFGIGLLFRLDLAELAMASAVCIGGPSSAPALASAKGWRNLMIPGILAGSFGYGIGSYIGFGLTTWLN